MDDTSIARSQLLGGHRILLNHLLSEIEEQRQNGQRVVELAPDGTPVRTTVKPMDAKLIGEAGRCLDRAARLLGLLDGPIEGSGGNQVTNITLAAPSDGCTFEQRWSSTNTTTVDATATESPSESPTGAIQGSSGVDSPAQPS
ncbi:hypothetical protein FQK07_09735 [Synechococcus sp. BSF8S]|uniref:hypothetical protein n=1 Tax=Synechococcales TaxID=1890424 RepID=UPI00162391AD|nr:MULTISPECIES: hypothetical protein [unclassified Synechococcus]MBC1261545.1 hypothetical protein [Synechococcus sp. BSF8S]MBC1264322.1 hypothetical protein [Synechococcus sp. BSA11S]